MHPFKNNLTVLRDPVRCTKGGLYPFLSKGNFQAFCDEGFPY